MTTTLPGRGQLQDQGHPHGQGHIDGLARFPLAVLPTPLTPARRLQAITGGPPLWVKRDDLIGFATAGNKARPLELLLGDALAGGCDAIVTGGGPGSNFCAAAAAAAQVAGIDCHLVIYGQVPAAGAALHPNLAQALACGAQLHFTGRHDRDELDVAVPARADILAAGGRRPVALPRGGATDLGALAFAHAFDELDDQLAAEGVEAGVLVVATGSGGTQAGLVAGHATAGAGGAGRVTRILGATVSRPPEQIRETVSRLAEAVAARRGRPGAPRALAPRVEILDARGPGFAIASDQGKEAARVARRTEGLLLDPVYTAKAMAVVLQLIKDGFDQPIVFWHTGGLPAAVHHLGRNQTPERSALCPI